MKLCEQAYMQGLWADSQHDESSLLTVQGKLSAAYDILTARVVKIPQGKTADKFMRAMLSGIVRHRQWWVHNAGLF